MNNYRRLMAFALTLELIAIAMIISACVSSKPIPPFPEPPVDVVDDFTVTQGQVRTLLGDFGFEDRIVPILAHAYTNGNVGVSNRWPVRVNIDLAIDGTNYTRRIAYGVPSVSNRRDIVYDYSMPWWDMTMITESAKLRITDLEGNVLTKSSNSFTIAGINLITPAAGETLVNGTTYDVSWKQCGNREYVTIGYITPTSGHVPLVNVSNILNGVNTYTWDISGLPATNQIKIVIQSAPDSLTNTLVGYSGIVSAQ